MKIVVGCSGGPDSMALLDMCYQKGNEIFVAHVNYQVRKSADRDEKIVMEYCQKHHLRYQIIHPEYSKGNFEAWARKVRYDFFKQCADVFQTKDIFVAHQLDDCLETYIFQKQRDMICETYGLAALLNQDGYFIHRPLLRYEKKELEEYCHGHHIAYGVDETNQLDTYTRNRIRHQYIDRMDKAEKMNVLKRIDDANQKLKAKRKQAALFQGDVSELRKQKDAWFVLDWYLYQYTNHHFSRKHMKSLLTQIQKDCLIDLNEYWLESWKGHIHCQKKRNLYNKICYSIPYGNFSEYKIVPYGKRIEGVTVASTDFPLCIRDVKAGDAIQLRWGKKKVSRFFIDRKISKLERMHWKVIENRDGNVIFVPGIGCDVEHFSIQPSFFMIQ